MLFREFDEDRSGTQHQASVTPPKQETPPMSGIYPPDWKGKESQQRSTNGLASQSDTLTLLDVLAELDKIEEEVELKIKKSKFSKGARKITRGPPTETLKIQTRARAETRARVDTFSSSEEFENYFHVIKNLEETLDKKPTTEKTVATDTGKKKEAEKTTRIPLRDLLKRSKK